MTPIQPRWLLRRDLPDVLAIERASFTAPWNECQFDGLLRRTECFGLVAETGDGVCGYLIGAIDPEQLQLLNLAVTPRWRRHGIGSRLLSALAERLATPRRLITVVSERNLAAHLFLRARGFRATRILRGHWSGTPDDAYLFEQGSGFGDRGSGKS
jgi:[ribosomal protein S18]-alanine N-acetyltransferase